MEKNVFKVAHFLAHFSTFTLCNESFLRLNFEWKDEFLAWNSSQAQGIDKLRLDVGDIWIPDIEVYNLVSRRGLREKEQVGLVVF